MKQEIGQKIIRVFCIIIEKFSAPFSFGSAPIWNVFSFGGNAPFFTNEPITMLLVHWWTTVIGSFLNETLPLIEIPFQIGSPPNDDGAEIFSMIVRQPFPKLDTLNPLRGGGGSSMMFSPYRFPFLGLNEINLQSFSQLNWP